MCGTTTLRCICVSKVTLCPWAAMSQIRYSGKRWADGCHISETKRAEEVRVVPLLSVQSATFRIIIRYYRMTGLHLRSCLIQIFLSTEQCHFYFLNKLCFNLSSWKKKQTSNGEIFSNHIRCKVRTVFNRFRPGCTVMSGRICSQHRLPVWFGFCPYKLDF